MSNIRKEARGFTLVEFLIILSVAVLLLGVAVPVIGTQQDDAKAADIVKVCDSLKSGVSIHFKDTGQLATEYSGKSYKGSQYHELSLNQAETSWKGPYIDTPVSSHQNPFGGFIYLYENLDGGSAKPGGGFKLTGPHGPLTCGRGQFVGFSRIPEFVARLIDEAFDEGVPGDWQTHGRVEWNRTNGGTLMVFLMGI